jgi:lysine 2,3-aminomutase
VPLITSLEQLSAYLERQGIAPENCELPLLAKKTTGFPLRFSEYYAGLIDWEDATDPLRKIVLPSANEAQFEPYELLDPIGDQVHEKVPGLIHRYPDRCLLLLTTHCHIHCRFCFRREVVGTARAVNLHAIHQYLSEHREVREVIFSGGDPFTMPSTFLERVLDHILSIENITTIRFHTRVPAADPDSISDDFFSALERVAQEKVKRLVIVLHVDHAREVTTAFRRVIDRLRPAEGGALLLSQSVLLRGVNATTQELAELYTALVNAGIAPYYLHHPDQAVGTSHFRVSIEEGKSLMRSLRNTVSAICLPEYVLDLPGGFGKIPVFWLKSLGKGVYRGRTFAGKFVEYADPAHETRIS